MSNRQDRLVAPLLDKKVTVGHKTEREILMRKDNKSVVMTSVSFFCPVDVLIV